MDKLTDFTTRTKTRELLLYTQVLTIAALAILLTAPLGSICISLLGPLLLNKDQQASEDNTGNCLDQLLWHNMTTILCRNQGRSADNR